MAWTFGKKPPSANAVEEARAKAIAADKKSNFAEAFNIWWALAEREDPEAVYTVGERLERGLGTVQNFVDALAFFRKAAELQWAPAYGKLGDIYLNGRIIRTPAGSDGAPADPAPASQGLVAALAAKRSGVPADPREAALWNELAAELGDEKAQVRLAYQHASGLGVPLDYAEARKWFLRASEQGHAGAQLGLGMLLAAGRGEARDLKAAISWLAKAAAQDNATAKACLAVLLTQPDSPSQDPALAVSLLHEAAETRLPEAMYLYGEFKRLGVGCEPDPSEAETWLRRAALTGHVKAMVAAGALLRDRTLPDHTTAAAFFREAADLDNGSAQFALAELYARGLGVPQDGRLAAAWFEKAAANGVVAGYKRLGALFADGLGIEQDFELAAEWFGKAKDAGAKAVSYEMATLLHYGLGCAVNGEEAVRLYKQASSEGDARASLRLGVIFAEGTLVEQNWQEAAKYYGLAAAQGDPNADLNLAFLMIRKLGVGDVDTGLRILKENAEAGNLKALWALFRLFSDGLYLPADEAQADYWLQRAADRGEPRAAIELAQRLRRGHPSPVDAERIFALLDAAARSGDADAQSLLGLIYYEGQIRPADPSEALVWFTRAANRGNVLAQAWLGDVLASGKGVPKDLETAVHWYRQAADQGHAGALLALTAMAPAPGTSPSEDEALFQKWKALAERGDPLAQRMAGDFLVRGVRCEPDLKAGADLLRRAADQGNVTSMMILAGLLTRGEIAPDRPGEAHERLRQAAEADDAEAAHNLALAYRYGMLGLAVDREAALVWFRRAAAFGHPQAQWALGDLIIETAEGGEAVSQAIALFTASARSGVPQAALRLARLHEGGLGVPRSAKVALDYYRQALEGGLPEAAEGLQRCSALV